MPTDQEIINAGHKRRRDNAFANSREFIKSLPTPLDLIANDLFDMNCEHWLTVDRIGTFGNDAVQETGFTQNQNQWLKEIKEKMEK